MDFVFYRALYKSKQKPWQVNQNCTKSAGLVKRQIKICRQNLDLMGTVTHAAYLTADTCQKQFSERRWNCSSIKKAPRLSRDLVRGKFYIVHFHLYQFRIL